MKKITPILLAAAAGIFVTATAFVAADAVKTAQTYNAYSNGVISSVEFDGNTCRVTLHNNNTGTDDVTVSVTTTNRSLLALMRKYEKSAVGIANSTKVNKSDISAIFQALSKEVKSEQSVVEKLSEEYNLVK
jgi:hypothetical protein